MIFVPFTNGKMFVEIELATPLSHQLVFLRIAEAPSTIRKWFILSQKRYQSKRNVLRMIEEYIAIRKTSVYVGGCIMPIK